MRTSLKGLVLALVFASTSGSAALKPETIHVADAQKTKYYIKDGLIVGGDQAIENVEIVGIRHSKNPEPKKPGYERMVIDLAGIKNGDSAPLNRPPYYQIDVSPELHRAVFTVWGNPKIGFNAEKMAMIHKAFKKSDIIQSVEFLPVIEKDRWTFILNFKQAKPLEVFELSNPTRIIVDLKK